MLERLNEIEKAVRVALQRASSQQDLDNIRAEFLGRKGALTSMMRSIRDVPPEQRPQFGNASNRLKNDLEEAFKKRLVEIQNTSTAKEGKTSNRQVETPEDITLPGRKGFVGHRHVLMSLLDEIVDVFHGMGFSTALGPDIESAYYNFDALNTQPNHPSRNIADTFYVKGHKPDDGNPYLLRTQTSPVQIRTMLSQEPPIRIISPGRCYRKDAIDATHYISFWQIEGLYVDNNVTMADLKGVLTAFATKILGPKTKIRFRPHFFPFTEPSVEYDFSCTCNGKGCRLCKGTGWIEISGAGMVDPEVFHAVGYDPERWQGYAFGMGVERIALIRHGIDDIRLLYQNDLRLLKQF